MTDHKIYKVEQSIQLPFSFNNFFNKNPTEPRVMLQNYDNVVDYYDRLYTKTVAYSDHLGD